MSDTSPDVQARFDELMRQRSGSDRVRMMSEMFDFAKELVLSNLRATHPGATGVELRVLLFERLYGDDQLGSAGERHRQVARRMTQRWPYFGLRDGISRLIAAVRAANDGVRPLLPVE